jgi:hypothetical protein
MANEIHKIRNRKTDKKQRKRKGKAEEKQRKSRGKAKKKQGKSRGINLRDQRNQRNQRNQRAGLFVDSVPRIDPNRPKSHPSSPSRCFPANHVAPSRQGNKLLWGRSTNPSRTPRELPQRPTKTHEDPRRQLSLLLKKLAPNVGPTLRYPERP